MSENRFLDGNRVVPEAFAFVCGQLPQVSGQLRSVPEDFKVDEDCDVALDGSGEHLWIRIEKTNLTTLAAIDRLAAVLGVAARHIGYSGLKDRHAVTRQWLSVAWPIKAALPVWPQEDDLRVLDTVRHGRKLRRGTHRRNHFVIRIRNLHPVDEDALKAALTRVRVQGVPNYFGPQRFGRDGRNLDLSRALFAGKRLSRRKRGFALSTARALLFNAVLDARVAAKNWDQAVPGDVFMLSGTHSIFADEHSNEIQDALQTRVANHDISPTGPMTGRVRKSALLPTGQAGEIENSVLNRFADITSGLAAADVDSERRALRLPVAGLDWALGKNDLTLSFSLPAGAYATSVIREIARIESSASGQAALDTVDT